LDWWTKLNKLLIIPLLIIIGCVHVNVVEPEILGRRENGDIIGIVGQEMLDPFVIFHQDLDGNLDNGPEIYSLYRYNYLIQKFEFLYQSENREDIRKKFYL